MKAMTHVISLCVPGNPDEFVYHCNLLMTA